MRITESIRGQLRMAERQARPCAPDLESPVDRVARMAKRRPSEQRWVDVIRCDPCSWCGGRGGTVEHVTPRSRGGPKEHRAHNSAGACSRCNNERANVTVLEYLLRRRHGAPRRHRKRARLDTNGLRIPGVTIFARNADALNFLTTKILKRSP